MAYFEFKNSPSKETSLSAENLKAMQKGLMELVFPIGSIYITQSNTNPNSILEFGTWERVKGKVLVGLDEDDKDFNTIGKTGGAKTVALTVDNIPKHRHEIGNDGGAVLKSDLSNWNSFSADGNVPIGRSSGWQNTEYAGGGQAHNNLQPYKVVGYMWIRIA